MVGFGLLMFSKQNGRRAMVIGVKRVLYFVLRLSPFGITVIFAAWLLLQSPFAAPLLDRSIEQTRSAITSAIARG